MGVLRSKSGRKTHERGRGDPNSANYESGDMWSRARAGLARRRVGCCLDSLRWREREIWALSVAGFDEGAWVGQDKRWIGTMEWRRGVLS